MMPLGPLRLCPICRSSFFPFGTPNLVFGEGAPAPTVSSGLGDGVCLHDLSGKIRGQRAEDTAINGVVHVLIPGMPGVEAAAV